MQRFFFDTAVDETETRDVEGIEYHDLATALRDARCSASQLLCEGKSRTAEVCVVTIRDDTGKTVRKIIVELREEGELPGPPAEDPRS